MLADADQGLSESAAVFAAGAAGEIIGAMTARIEQIVTSGTFSLDDQDFAVDNNVWLVGDDHEVVVIDAAHDAAAVLAAVGGRRLAAVVSTHGHNDHISAAPDVAAQTGAP